MLINKFSYKNMVKWYTYLYDKCFWVNNNNSTERIMTFLSELKMLLKEERHF